MAVLCVVSMKQLVTMSLCKLRGYTPVRLALAKTTSLLCAVSLGFGISTYILYRLYCRYIQPFFRKPPDGKSEPSTANKSTETNHEEEGSGMGNTGSNDESPPIRYNAREDVVVGLPERSPNIPMSPTKPRQRRRKQRKNINADKARPRRPRPRDSVSVSSDEGDNQLNISHDASDWETGSLKGNLSIRSLSERNVKYGFGNEKFCETNKEQKRVTDEDPTQVERAADKEIVNNTVQQKETTVGDHSGHDVVDCSVLLTPPSEEEALAYANITNLRGTIQSTTPTSSNEADRSALENYVSFGPLSSSGAISGVMSSSGAMSISDQDEDKDVSTDANTKILTTNTGSTDNDNNQLRNQTLQQEVTGTLDNVPLLIDTIDNHTFTTADGFIHKTPEKNTRTSSSGDDTSNSSSPFKSASSHLHGQSSSSGNMSVDDEGTTDSLSSLGNRKFDKGFQQSLLHRLHEYTTGGSNSTSLETSPDISPYHRASSGISSRQESLSDLATSDSEIFNMEGSSSYAEQEFSKIEGEIGHLDEEFVSLNNKLAELMTKSATSSGNSAVLPSLCVDTESKSLPASPVRKQNDALLSNKKLKHCMSGNSSQSHSDSSFSPQHLHSEGVDLSWEYYDMNPENLPGNSQFKGKDEDDSGNIVVQKEESSDGFSAADEDNGHTTCDDLEMDSCNDGTGEDNSSRTDQSTTGSVQIGNKVNIVEYAEREWRGETDKASTIKQAYTEVVKTIPCQNLQPIRGDNYCAIRGCVFQCLCNKLSPRCVWTSLDSTLSLLHTTFNDPASSLHRWSFAGRLIPQEPLAQMQACLTFLFSKFEEVEQLMTYEERHSWVMTLLNSDPPGDVMLMEGVKLLMMLEAVRLYNRSQTGAEDIPLFVWLMFARDTSDTPAKFVTNHLNCVGNTAGLEQVEMFLLGHVLGVSIQVFRLSHFGQGDFVSYYPENPQDQLPVISLLAEDDRHYNVPVL